MPMTVENKLLLQPATCEIAMFAQVFHFHPTYYYQPRHRQRYC